MHNFGLRLTEFFRIRRNLVVAVLPLLLFVLHGILWPGNGGIYCRGEPDFGYLVNSADIKLGLPPAHTDHPGTPVQVMGVFAIVIVQVWHLFTPGFQWFADVLTHPEKYILFTSLGLLICAALSLWLLGKALLSKGYSLACATFLQLLALLPRESWAYITRVSPEKMLFAANCLLAVWIFTADRKKISFPILLGLISGFAVANKYNAIPLVFFVLLAPGLKGKLIGFVSAIFGFFFFTFPMYGAYEQSFVWLQLIWHHQGIYGTGAEGVVPTSALLLDNLQMVWREEPVLLVATILGLLEGLRTWKKNKDAPVCWLVLFAMALIVWKHPGGRYLMPAMAPLMVLEFPIAQKRTWIWIALLLPILWGNYSESRRASIGLWVAGDRTQKLEEFRVSHPECAWVYITPVSRLESAIAAGNGSAAHRHTDDLLRLYPDWLSYVVSPSQFQRFGKPVPISDIKKLFQEKGCLYLGGIYYQVVSKDLHDNPLFQFDLVSNDYNGFGAYIIRVNKFRE